MNFSEFKALLGADPWNRAPETLRARQSDATFEQAAKDAESFERKLQSALEVPADPSLIGELVAVGQRPEARRYPAWLAMAASIVLVAGVVATVWLQTRPPQDIRQYVTQHYGHDGETLLAAATGFADGAEVARILAGFGVRAEPALSAQVRLIKYCPTPDGRGAHMIVDTRSGPVHLIYMPATGVEDGRAFDFDGVHTRLVDLNAGSAALIGKTDQPLEDLDELVREALLPLPTKT